VTLLSLAVVLNFITPDSTGPESLPPCVSPCLRLPVCAFVVFRMPGPSVPLGVGLRLVCVCVCVDHPSSTP